MTRCDGEAEMTEKEAKTRRKTPQKASAQEKPQEKEQPASQPLEETEQRQESVARKAPEVVSAVLQKLKKGATVAYGTSSILVRDGYHAASDYADKYKHKIEVKKLKAQRDAVSSMLGSIVYTRIIIDGEPPGESFSDPEITSLLQQIQELDKDVVRIGDEILKY